MYVSHIPVCRLLVKFAPAQVQDGNLLYVTCVVAVSPQLVFAITVPMDRIRKSLGARVSATDSAVKPVLAVKPVVPALTAVP